MMKTLLLARHALGADEDASCGDKIVPKKRVPPKQDLETGDAPTAAVEVEGVEWRRNYTVKFKVHQPYNCPWTGRAVSRSVCALSPFPSLALLPLPISHLCTLS